MTESTPITGLPENTGRVGYSDLFLMSKKIDGEFESRKMTYATLTSNISTDILPLVPKSEFPLYTSELPLNAVKQDMAYSTKSVTDFYNQTQDQVTDIRNNKLDKATTNDQTVQSKVNFKKAITCPTSASSSGSEVVNIDYLKQFLNKGLYVTEFKQVGTYGWYKKYSNGWCEQGGRQRTVSDNNIQQIKFHVAFKNSNYTVNATPAGSDLGDNHPQGIYVTGVYTLDKSYFWFKNDLVAGEIIMWTAQGFVS